MFQLRNESGVVVLVVRRTAVAAVGTVLADRAVVVFFRTANVVDQLLQVFAPALQAVDRLVQATRENEIDKAFYKTRAPLVLLPFDVLFVVHVFLHQPLVVPLEILNADLELFVNPQPRVVHLPQRGRLLGEILPTYQTVGHDQRVQVETDGPFVGSFEVRPFGRIPGAVHLVLPFPVPTTVNI